MGPRMGNHPTKKEKNNTQRENNFIDKNKAIIQSSWCVVDVFWGGQRIPHCGKCVVKNYFSFLFADIQM